MKIPAFSLALLCVALCSCERGANVKLRGVGDDPTWISSDEARRIGEQLITNRYPQAQIVWALGTGRTFTYRFATNGTVLPLEVVVDRETREAKFESSSP